MHLSHLAANRLLGALLRPLEWLVPAASACACFFPSTVPSPPPPPAPLLPPSWQADGNPNPLLAPALQWSASRPSSVCVSGPDPRGRGLRWTVCGGRWAVGTLLAASFGGRRQPSACAQVPSPGFALRSRLFTEPLHGGRSGQDCGQDRGQDRGQDHGQRAPAQQGGAARAREGLELGRRGPPLGSLEP